ncbi:hypothetical protein GCM10027299_48940 [Larkinella ripae]
MEKLLNYLLAVGILAVGWIVTSLFYAKLGLLVFLTPAPYVFGYGLMKLARYKK